jgi:hypothetical protein
MAQKMQTPVAFYQDGKTDFPHGAGPTEPGWFVYEDESRLTPPAGPFGSWDAAKKYAEKAFEPWCTNFVNFDHSRG